MTESFIQLFEESLKKISISPGSIIRANVINITKDIVLVDTGLKSESAIPIEQFYDAQGELEVKVGDWIDVMLDAIEDGFGETVLSREKAKRHEAWNALEKAHEQSTIVVGIVNGKVKGGFTVELNGIRAFLPGSLVDIRPIHDSLYLEGKELEFKVIKLDQKRNNVVVSRRAVIESENSAERDNLLKRMQENMKIKGIVKNLTDYGAFIDLGGVDGLLHITDMAWKRVKHPKEIVNLGDEIIVKVLKFDRERNRVSLGLKQLIEDPWISITKKCKEGDKLIGKVTNLTDYGCFIEIEGGIEGLVHISEMDWVNKNMHPSKIVSIGDSIEVMILDIDEERRRISLGLKQCKLNPWQSFFNNYKKGDHVVGKIKSITDFGIFIGLNGGIDGLIHISDISWNAVSEDDLYKYKKGDEITAMVLQVDVERERISLGLKQLLEDPLINFLSLNKKGSIVLGEVLSIDKKKGAVIKLSEGIGGYLKSSEIIDINNEFIINIGDIISVKIIGVDRKNRIINLSICSKNYKNKDENIANISHNTNIQQDSHLSNVMTEAFKAATKNE